MRFALLVDDGSVITYDDLLRYGVDSLNFSLLHWSISFFFCTHVSASSVVPSVPKGTTCIK